MNSISNKHFGDYRFKLSTKNLYDFKLADTEPKTTEIPTPIIDLIYNTNLLSNKEIWSGAKGDSLTLDTFGLTGIDNGRMPLVGTYEESLTPFTLNSTLFELHKVGGNTGKVYDVEYDEVNNHLELRGGFFQGFYKLDGYEYQTLPNHFEKGWVISMDLRRSAEEIPNTINTPNTKGFFFYTGTRAENKYWNTYEPEISYSGVTNNDFIIPLNPPRIVVKKMENQFLIYGRSSGHKICTDNNTFTFGTHRAQDIEKDEDGNVAIYYTGRTTFDTFEEINPFLKYGRSNGKPVCGDDSDHVDFTDSKGRTYDYGTARAQDDTNNDNLSDTLNVNEGIAGNALGFRITDEGEFSYRRVIEKDPCITVPLENEVESNEDYIVIEETTDFKDDGIELFPVGVWKNITLKWETNIPYNCYATKPRMGKLYLFVDNNLKWVFQNFAEIMNYELEEDKDKQLGVPYNISIGGGTQGLLDNQTFGGQDQADLDLGLQRHFAGTFIGDIRNFKMYGEPLSWCDIKKV